MTKVTEPWPLFVTYFYYYYSYFSLCLTWIISPFLFYTILTQSKKLGNFKWFILNHSFWCLAFETVFGIFKPMILLPIAAGYQIGPFRHLWNWKSSIVACFLCCGITGSCVISVSATVASRYLLIFPGSLFKWFNLKIAVAVGLLLNIGCYGLIIYAMYPLFELDKSTLIQWTADTDPSLLKIIQNEPTFVILPRDYHFKVDAIILLALSAIHGIGAFIFLFFFYQLRKQKSTVLLTNKLQRSLIISSLAQMLIISAFLLIPLMFFFGFVFFEIPNTSFLINLCFLNSHGFLEFFSTFYFVNPYRKFALQFFRDIPMGRNRARINASVFHQRRKSPSPGGD